MKRFQWLAKQIRKHNYKLGAEVGTGRGNTGQHLLRTCPGLHLVQVVYYPGDCVIHSLPQKLVWDQRVGTPFKKRITVIEKPSLQAAEQVKDASLDFVFIDADHSYEACLSDINAWLPKVRPGGLLCGHDFMQPDFPGVEQAVREYFGKEFGKAERHDYMWFHFRGTEE
jgi:hypothetical protein